MSENPDEEFLHRFGGIARLYGLPGLMQFKNSHVAVIGIGGVGSWAAESLARSGIGHISLFDLDDVCVSNINRQIHAMQNTVGRMKVDVMAERLQLINPQLQVSAHQSFVTPTNVEKNLNTSFDYVFDATDSVKAKTAIAAHCKRQGIRLICCGGAGGQTDPTRIAIADMSRTTQDALLAKVRNNLRRHHDFTRNPKRKFGITCVYSTEQLRYPHSDGSICLEKPDTGGAVKLDCASGFGAVTHLTASFAMVAVGHILDQLNAKVDLVGEAVD